MDTFKTPGNYICAQSANATTLKNAPFSNAFTLKVELSTGADYPCQTYREFNTGRIAYRYYNAYGVIRLKRLLNHYFLNKWSSKMIKKSFEPYFL